MSNSQLSYVPSHEDRIFIAGHTGLVGSALARECKKKGYTHLILQNHSELNLTNQMAVESFFDQQRPDHVFLAAAKVGGILANQTHPAEFIYQNLAIQTNVIHAAWRHRVKRLIFLGSSCIYPRECLQPIKEEYLLTGPLESTNRSYAIAKIAGIEQCWSYNREYHTLYLSIMPTNLYGPLDHYDLQQSHVLPALIRKFHEAKISDKTFVELWGTGIPRREFLFVDDLAAACLFLFELPEVSYQTLTASYSGPWINIGYGKDITIAELASLVADVLGYSGAVVWDKTKPDGTPQKLLDSTRILSLGWSPQTTLKQGIEKTYKHYLQSLEGRNG